MSKWHCRHILELCVEIQMKVRGADHCVNIGEGAEGTPHVVRREESGRHRHGLADA